MSSSSLGELRPHTMSVPPVGPSASRSCRQLAQSMNPDSVLRPRPSCGLSSSHLPAWLPVPVLCSGSAPASPLTAFPATARLPPCSWCGAPSCLTALFRRAEFCSYLRVRLKCSHRWTRDTCSTQCGASCVLPCRGHLPAHPRLSAAGGPGLCLLLLRGFSVGAELFNHIFALYC